MLRLPFHCLLEIAVFPKDRKGDRIKPRHKNHSNPQPLSTHWVIAVSPKNRQGDRIKSRRENHTHQQPVIAISSDRILPTSFEIECDSDSIE
jgi:hypothetical protein